MFFRFAAALTLVVLISIIGTALEKQTLEVKRAASRQAFQIDLLMEMHTQLRLSIQQQTAPAELAKAQRTSLLTNSPAAHETATMPPAPLYRWQQPAPAPE